MVAVVAIAFAATSCSKADTAAPRGRDEAVRSVKVDPVGQHAVMRSVEVVGTLAAVDEVTVSSEADGVVSRILHDLGAHVHAGDVMVQIDRDKAE